jgi:hypothetical protein
MTLFRKVILKLVRIDAESGQCLTLFYSATALKTGQNSG